MVTSLEYLATKFEELSNDYKIDPGLDKDALCSVITNELVKILLNEGKIPSIIYFVGRILKEDGYHFKALHPLRYGNTVKWIGHIVCCAENLVYDPLIGRPVPLKDYSKIAFGDDFVWHILIDQESIINYVNGKIPPFNSMY